MVPNEHVPRAADRSFGRDPSEPGSGRTGRPFAWGTVELLGPGGGIVRAGADRSAAIFPSRGTWIAFLNPGERTQVDGIALVLRLHPRSLRGLFGAAAPRRPFRRRRARFAPELRQLARHLFLELPSRERRARERCRFAARALAWLVADLHIAGAYARLWTRPRYADARIRRAVRVLHARARRGGDIKGVADEIGISRSRFYDLFRAMVGIPPRAYFDKLCVARAIVSIGEGQRPMHETSKRLGWSAQGNFTRFFISHVGMAPSRYRAARRQRRLNR